MLITARTGKTVTSNTQIQTRDHIVIMVYTLLLYLSLHLALVPNVLWSMLGWFAIVANWNSYNIYCTKRAAGEYD